MLQPEKKWPDSKSRKKKGFIAAFNADWELKVSLFYYKVVYVKKAFVLLIEIKAITKKKIDKDTK